jgi:hypothetical protein
MPDRAADPLPDHRSAANRQATDPLTGEATRHSCSRHRWFRNPRRTRPQAPPTTGKTAPQRGDDPSRRPRVAAAPPSMAAI